MFIIHKFVFFPLGMCGLTVSFLAQLRHNQPSCNSQISQRGYCFTQHLSDWGQNKTNLIGLYCQGYLGQLMIMSCLTYSWEDIFQRASQGFLGLVFQNIKFKPATTGGAFWNRTVRNDLLKWARTLFSFANSFFNCEDYFQRLELNQVT